jgi:hypothetical protein
MTNGARSELKNTGYEIFIGLLSVLSIVNLGLVYLLRNNYDLQTVLRVMNALFSFIFLIDFVLAGSPILPVTRRTTSPGFVAGSSHLSRTSQSALRLPKVVMLVPHTFVVAVAVVQVI